QELLGASLGKVHGYLASSLNPQLYEKNFGVSVNDIERVVFAAPTANSPTGSPDWFFAAARTTKPIKTDVFKTQMGLKSGGQIGGQEYCLMDAAEMLKILGFMNPAQIENARTKQESIVAVRFPDEQTVIIAGVPMMKKFLESGGNPAAAAPAPATGGQQPTL